MQDLEILQNMELLYNLQVNSDLAWDERYPALKNGPEDIGFQYKGENYTLRLYTNDIMQRLYYSVFNQYNERDISFYPVVSYPLPLFKGLYFYQNKIYLDNK